MSRVVVPSEATRSRKVAKAVNSELEAWLADDERSMMDSRAKKKVRLAAAAFIKALEQELEANTEVVEMMYEEDEGAGDDENTAPSFTSGQSRVGTAADHDAVAQEIRSLQNAVALLAGEVQPKRSAVPHALAKPAIDAARRDIEDAALAIKRISGVLVGVVEANLRASAQHESRPA